MLRYATKVAGRKRGSSSGNEIFLEADNPSRNAADQRDSGGHRCARGLNARQPSVTSGITGGKFAASGLQRGPASADEDANVRSSAANHQAARQHLSVVRSGRKYGGVERRRRKGAGGFKLRRRRA